MYSPVASISIDPDDTSANVSSLSSSSQSSSSSSSLYTYPSSSPSLFTESSKKYHHSQSYSLGTLQVPSSSFSPPSQFFPSQNGPLNHISTQDPNTNTSATAAAASQSTGVPSNSRSHHKTYGNHSISHTMNSIEGPSDRSSFHPSHNLLKSRSISVSSPTEIFMPDFQRGTPHSSNIASNNDMVSGANKFHSRSISSIPHSRSSLVSSSSLSFSSRASTANDFKSNVIFENRSGSQAELNLQSNSYSTISSTMRHNHSRSGTSPSFLKAETTADEFPILVRRESSEFPVFPGPASLPESSFEDQSSLPTVSYSPDQGHFTFAPKQRQLSSSHSSADQNSQSLSSMFSTCSIQPHPSLADHSEPHFPVQWFPVQNKGEDQISSPNYSTSNTGSKPSTRAKSAKRSYTPVSHVQNNSFSLNSNPGLQTFIPNQNGMTTFNHQQSSQQQQHSQHQRQHQHQHQRQHPHLQTHQHQQNQQIQPPVYSSNSHTSAPFIKQPQSISPYRASSFNNQNIQPAVSKYASESGRKNMTNSPRPTPSLNRSVSAPFHPTPPRHFSINRRQQEVEAANRFTNAELKDFVGDIYSLCKDQHGCRYLQKVLEEKNESDIDMIFSETKSHTTELMTDLFGNYMCQKLLEKVSTDQRTVLVQNASPDLTKIALNQHGTRALQKMIEFAVSKEQVKIIVESLKGDVVRLIQDLNGNHVIQKCLNHLACEDSQFIIDTVSENCITVGTHRHGCCVLQRCIDHSSEKQRQQLITKIIENSFVLVKDPFGNYVIQYVLDLSVMEYSEPLIRRFVGHTCLLSMQKFSSNVIEKCLRIALPDTRKLLIEELMSCTFLDSLLRDSYANYVIQTALEQADEVTKEKILQSIVPILPSIRNTPYGRKIISKIASTYDSGSACLDIGQQTMAQQLQHEIPLGHMTGLQGPLPNQHPRQFSNQLHSVSTPMYPYYTDFNGFTVPQPVGPLAIQSVPINDTTK